MDNKDNSQLLLYFSCHVSIMMIENAIVKPSLMNEEDSMERLTRLIIERDDLLYHVAPDLRAEYMMKVGALENLVWKKRLELSMAKRRLNLIRSYLNRDDEPDMIEIEAVIEYEYEDLMQELRERNDEMKAIMDYIDSECLTQEESKELRDLYTKIVKRLHPDVNPNAADEDILLFEKAVKAYKSGNLDMIRAIYYTMDPDKAEAIYVEDLKTKIAEVLAQIEKIKSVYPFDKVSFMKDREAVRKRNEELNKIMDSVTEELQNVNRVIKELMQ